MQPRTREQMDEIVRILVRDCLELVKQGGLRQTDLAKMLGTSRLTVSKWEQHMEETDDWTTLPVTGSTSATIFFNLLIVRRLMELDLANGRLPVETAPSAKRWVREYTTDATR